MPRVNVKGVSNPIDFPDDMDIEDIKAFLQKRFAGMAARGESTVDVSPIQATAQASNPSMQEKFSQGVGNALTSTGLVDDNYQAQNIGKNIGNIAAFSPAGAAFGGDEFGTAAAKNDKLGMALGALEGVGIGGDIAKLAIFGGVLAKSADLGALAKAQKLETGGANRDKIWEDTGWVNDKGDWKFEIDDSEMKINLDSFSERKKPFTDEVERSTIMSSEFMPQKAFDGDVVTPNYEGLGFTKIQIKDTGRDVRGSYLAEDNQLTLSDKLNNEDLNSTALHELQHGIQQREGFQGGGNPGEFKQAFTENRARLNFLEKDPETMRVLSEVEKAEDAIIMGDLEFDVMEKSLFDLKAKYRRESPHYKEYSKVMQGLQGKSESGFNEYKMLAGEAEARNVQTRLSMTADQRRKTPPWKTLDVPEDELIYRNNTPQTSLSGGDAAKKGVKTIANLSDEITKIKGVKTLNLFEDRKGDIKLDTIIIDKSARGEGVGSKAMQNIIDYADKNKKRVKLTPAVKDDFQGTTSQTRLRKFYKRFGFVENKGRNKDFAISELMYREPSK